jgi:hypothetical protein
MPAAKLLPRHAKLIGAFQTLIQLPSGVSAGDPNIDPSSTPGSIAAELGEVGRHVRHIFSQFVRKSELD